MKFDDFNINIIVNNVKNSKKFFVNDDYIKLINLLDLTKLKLNDSLKDLENFIESGFTNFGNVAAFCIEKDSIRFCKEMLNLKKNNFIKVATVVNFPNGDLSENEIIDEIKFSINEGADEIDFVWPYEEYLNGNSLKVEKILKKVRMLTKNHVLKIIIESGVFEDNFSLYNAVNFIIKNGNPDFLKTSTGKIPKGATLESAAIILYSIKNIKTNIYNNIGLKVSGGIRDVNSALQYLELIENIFDSNWISNKNFRIGASSLLNNILNKIS